MTRLQIVLSIALVVSTGAIAADRHGEVIHGAIVGATKTEVDTVYILGGPGRLDGKFEDAAGNSAWNGWTHTDLTAYVPVSFWQVSEFMAPNGQFAMWCGTEFEGGDRGYENDWNQSLLFSHEVANNQIASTVLWTATLRYDSEPDYDYTYLEVNRGGEWQELQAYDGQRSVAVSETIVVAPEDYVGSNSNEIQLRVRFASDSAYSDEDGLWDTDGACQYDDVSVLIDGVLVEFEDFEDQVSDRWHPVIGPGYGVGDFAALWTNLQDLDPCKSNYSPQVAFIDDGVVVPGTGGSHCITWCYGPGGYIVNNTGGIMGPNFHLSNLVLSPVLDWPDGCDAAQLSCDVYRHEELEGFGTWPGIFFQLKVRSTADPVNQPIENEPWWGDAFLHYGGPDYRRTGLDLSGLLVSDRVQIQVATWVVEWGYVWGWDGIDGTPAPYLDNISVAAWPSAGPHVQFRDIDLANDNFPAAGILDLANLANNSVRFDMARNISQWPDLVNNPGDSLVFDVACTRSGSQIVVPPRMYVRMLANPLFSAVRTLPPGFVQHGDIVDGIVDADSCFWSGNPPGWARWQVDLPDSGFFFPGDVIHYYIEARDEVSGDIGVTIVPPDTSGFASFDDRYHRDFIVRALPTLFSTTPGDQPPVLFWQDAIDRGGHDEWLLALGQLGYQRGVDYDMYANNGPASGVGNGLGGRATSELLSGYSTMLYTSGTLSVNLLANGDFDDDPSDDLAVVSAWFSQGGKNAFMTGDDLVTGLLDEGTQGSTFVTTYFDVNHVDASILELIGNQTAPTVLAIADNGIINRVPTWIAFGSCPDLNRFDAIEPSSGAVRLAEFTDPSGNPGAYSYAAAIYHHHAAQDARVVMMPVDFMSLYNQSGWAPPTGYEGIAARAIILEDILTFFGESGSSIPVSVAPDAPLRVTQYPNPFNPTTTIALDLPRAGEVSLKIYNLRGALVRTLLDERLAAGRHEIAWNGTDDRGASVASGVYFAETRADGAVRVHKLALVK